MLTDPTSDAPLCDPDALVAAFRRIYPGLRPCPNHPGDPEPWETESTALAFRLDLELFAKILAAPHEEAGAVSAVFGSLHAEDHLYLYDPTNLETCPICGALIPAWYSRHGDAV